MIKVILIKIVIILLCIPAWPLIMFAEYYDHRTHFYSRKFSIKMANKEYWEDVRDAITYRKED